MMIACGDSAPSKKAQAKCDAPHSRIEDVVFLVA